MGVGIDWAVLVGITSEEMWIGIILICGALVISYVGNSARLMKRVDELQTRIFSLQDEVARCHMERADSIRENVSLRAELQLVNSRVKALEAGTGLAPPPPLSGIIVADLKGVIQEFSPALTPILHYLPSEMAGKSIEVCVPPELLERHREKFRAAAENPGILDPTKEILTYALDKSGTRVPIGITLHGWKTGDATWNGLITATIRQRLATEDSQVRKAVVP